MTYVEVAYTPKGGKTIIKKIDFQQNMSVKCAISISGLQELYPEINNYSVGVYKNIVTQDYLLNPKDRVEIYRPLLICPKEKRRKLAK